MNNECATQAKEGSRAASARMGTVCVISAGTLWATMGLFVRPLGALGFSPLQISAMRLLAAVLIFAAVIAATDRSAWRIKMRDLPLLAGLGVCSVAFFTACYYVSIQVMSLSAAAILLYTSPIWVMLMSIVVFHEKVTARKAIALALAFTGCVLVSGIGGSVTVIGIIAGLGSGIGYALYSILGTLALRRCSSLTVTAYAMLFAFIGTFAVCDVPSLFAHIEVVQATAQGISGLPGVLMLPINVIGAHGGIALAGFLLLMGLVTATAPYLLYTHGLEFLQASHAAIIATVEPIVATLISVFALGEPLGIASLAGIACVLGAIVTLNTGNAKSPA